MISGSVRRGRNLKNMKTLLLRYSPMVDTELKVTESGLRGTAVHRVLPFWQDATAPFGAIDARLPSISGGGG